MWQADVAQGCTTLRALRLGGAGSVCHAEPCKEPSRVPASAVADFRARMPFLHTLTLAPHHVCPPSLDEALARPYQRIDSYVPCALSAIRSTVTKSVEGVGGCRVPYSVLVCPTCFSTRCWADCSRLWLSPRKCLMSTDVAICFATCMRPLKDMAPAFIQALVRVYATLYTVGTVCLWLCF